jgi:predicted nucleotidyltransferase
MSGKQKIPTILTVNRRKVLEIIHGHGANNVRVLDPLEMGGSPGGEIHLLVEMKKESTVLDVLPVEEELTDLLRRPVMIVLDQSFMRGQRSRLKAEAVGLE